MRELFEEMLEHNILTLPEIKLPYEVGRINNLNYCLYHQLMSHLVENCFVRKGKIQDLINNRSISHPNDSLNASVHQLSITEDAQSINESQKRTMGRLLIQERNGRYSKVKAPRSVEIMLISSE